MKKFFIICLTQFIAVGTFAQGIKITGKTVDEDSIPVVSANIVLHNADNQLIQGVETNDAGEFTLQNLSGGGDYKLTVSFIGYENQEFDFEKPQKDIDLQTVILFKSSTELEGVVVKSAKTRILDDRRIIYPTQKQLQITADGVSLLNAMKLPQLSVVPGTTEVTYWGRGDLKFYINDNEATVKQVRALSPKDIASVEYIDRPNIEYGAGTGLVIKYITKKTERGVTNSINVDKPLNRNYGSVDVESRINYKNSEFAVNYDAKYDKSKHFHITKTDETFNLNSGTLHRNETTTNAFGTSVNNDIALAYIYSRPQKERFYIKTQYSALNAPNTNRASVLYHSGIRNDTTNKYNWSSRKNKTFTSALYYRKYFSEKQFLTLHSTYYSTRLYNMNNYMEIDNNNTAVNNISNNVDANSQGLYAQALYGITFSDKIKLTTALLNQYTNAKNTYTGTNASYSNVKRNLTTFYNQLSGSFGKLYLDLYLSLRRDAVDISAQYKYTRIAFDPYLSGRYVFNDRNYIELSMGFGFERPSIADLSDATQIIDDVQSRKGNPSLKTGYSLYPGLNGNIGIGKFDISWYSNWNFDKNSIWEETYLENNTVVRMPDNVRSINSCKNECEITPDLFDWLSMSLAFGYNRYENKGYNYSYTYNNLYLRFNASVNWKRWTLSSVVWTHNNESYGENIWTSGRFIILTLLRTWFDSKLSTSLTMYNPFSNNYSKQGIINYSKIAPYENWMHYNASFRLLILNVSYKFNFGRKSSSDNVKTGVRAETGTVSRDKSAEQK